MMDNQHQQFCKMLHSSLVDLHKWIHPHSQIVFLHVAVRFDIT